MRDRSKHRGQGASLVRETPTAETVILNTETTVQTTTEKGTIEEIAQFFALLQAAAALSERDLATLVSSFTMGDLLKTDKLHSPQSKRQRRKQRQ